MAAGLIESYPLRRYLLDKARGKARDYHPCIYSIRLTGVQAGTPVFTGSVDIDTDAPFLWLGGVYACRSDGGLGDPIVGHLNAAVTLRIGGPGARSFTRTGCGLPNLYSVRGFVKMLPAAYPIEAGSQLHATLSVLTNIGGQQPYVVDLMHVGLKLFGYGGAE